MRDFLQSEGAKISTQSLLDRLTLEDQQEFQKYHRFARLQGSKAMNMYLEDFSEIQSALVAAKGKLWHLENGTSDSQKKEPSYEESVKKATEEVEKQRVKIEAYTKGTIAPWAIRDAVFEMNPIFHQGALKNTVRAYAKAKTKKDWE
jgi:GMP synthase PP-ATPase subunit